MEKSSTHKTLVYKNCPSCLYPEVMRECQGPRNLGFQRVLGHLQVILATLKEIAVGLNFLLQPCLDAKKKAVFLILALDLCPDLNDLGL